MLKKQTPQQINSITHRINFYPKERLRLFLELDPTSRVVVLSRLSKYVRRNIVNRLPQKELLSVLEDLDPDEATDIIQLLPARRQSQIIPKLNAELKNSVELLSKFDPSSAAGLMNIDYIQVEESETVADVAERFRAHEHRTGRLPAVIVMSQGRLKGYLPGHELGFGKPHERIAPYVRKIQVIRHNADHNAVVSVFREHPHNKIVVTGERGNVIGIIYSDDALRILGEQESASLYDFAGVSDEEAVTDGALAKVKNRYQWLVLNLATAFFAAFTVGLFSETISKYVLLAVYMPIVAGMGGNAGTQTLAVLVRGIAMRQIDLRNAWPTLKREVAAGFLNGLINGVLVALVVLFFNRDPELALVLALAMVINLCVAGFFGSLVPLVMKRLGKDPATSATIFITTATDVLGFLAFLGLAQFILG
ncbi:MAG TPA: magnesium transporter [Patescibacteria group bacterium]|nr:magnesium transporter [Patescibacteria group bacterium]